MALFAMTGCAVLQNENATPENQAIQSRIFYGTDRNLEDIEKPARYYGLKQRKLTYGRAELTVLQPNGKAQLDAVIPRSQADFIADLNEAISATPKPMAMVFTHGYNCSFHKSAKLAARFSELAGFQGITILWSWPSSHNPAG